MSCSSRYRAAHASAFIIRAGGLNRTGRLNHLDNATRVVHRALMPHLGGIRIIFVLPSLEIGGAERQALLLARYLRDEEHADVRV